mmetsp:Transcript_8119/g.20859  ORF Transcript_8119/g.20859 Transcript_8119/m.20859 type:complete len:348 (+) Transcript_8119:888-1931(+)
MNRSEQLQELDGPGQCWRSREEHDVPCLLEQRKRFFGPLGLVVLQIVRLVTDDHLERFLLHQLEHFRNEVVGDDHELVVQAPLVLAVAYHRDLIFRDVQPLVDGICPLDPQRGRSHNQHRPSVFVSCRQGQRLHCLTQTHFVPDKSSAFELEHVLHSSCLEIHKLRPKIFRDAFEPIRNLIRGCTVLKRILHESHGERVHSFHFARKLIHVLQRRDHLALVSYGKRPHPHLFVPLTPVDFPQRHIDCVVAPPNVHAKPFCALNQLQCDVHNPFGDGLRHESRSWGGCRRLHHTRLDPRAVLGVDDGALVCSGVAEADASAVTKEVTLVSLRDRGSVMGSLLEHHCGC